MTLSQELWALSNLKDRMEIIAGEWNGDLPGLQEERADTALEVIAKIDEINELLEQLE